MGRITSETRVIGSQTYTTTYAYDAADHVTEITYPSGRIVTYARNALGQVSGVTTKQNSGSSAVNVATSVVWKPMSDLLGGMTHGNGLATTAGYDLDYHLTSLLLQDGATEVSSQNILVAPIANGEGGVASLEAAEGECVFNLTFTFASGKILERPDTDLCQTDGIMIE